MSIEVDGEPGEPRFEGCQPRPTWGMPIAIVIVGSLVLSVGWTVLTSGGASTTSRPAPVTAPPTPRSDPPATAEGPLVSAVPTQMPVTAQPSEPAPNMRDPVEAARASLAAWGHFAATGDLTEVRRSFVAGGPQLTQLEAEAGRMTPPAGPSAPGYVVTLTNPRSEAAPGVATVTGTVVWSRIGEADRAYDWAIELHQAEDGTWRLFTVRTPES